MGYDKKYENFQQWSTDFFFGKSHKAMTEF